MTKDWTLGEYRPSRNGSIPTAAIDYMTDVHCKDSHWSKIEVHGDDCRELAEFLVDILNKSKKTVKEVKYTLQDYEDEMGQIDDDNYSDYYDSYDEDYSY